jgi:hypothetical protein
MARIMAFSFSALFLFCAAGIYVDNVETFLPHIWVPLFVLCAASTFLFACTWNVKLMRFTGVLIPCVFLGRLYAVIDRVLKDPYIGDGRALIGIGVYGMLTLSSILIWGQIFPRVVVRQGVT